MPALTRRDLYSLEKYAEIRSAFRARVMAHKKTRRLALGDHAALYFESALTMQYQVQEMLRIERIFDPAGIQAELDVYNPLIPDGDNWKATFMLEYADERNRRRALGQLVGIESAVWLRVNGQPPVYAIANEDLERSTPEKTAAVHFLRFELDPPAVAAVLAGKPMMAGIDHPGYEVAVPVPAPIRDSLAGDLRPSA